MANRLFKFQKPIQGNIRIASFDIGKKNFAQYIEDANVENLLRLEKKYTGLPKSLQRRVKGAMNSKILEILDEIYLSGERVHTGVYDLRNDLTSDRLDIPTRLNIIQHLESFAGLWDTCDIFIIEQQFFKTWNGRSKRSAGTEANVDAIKIAEGVLMWFLNEYPFKTVEYFGSQNKTQILGAPWYMKKEQRKKWAKDKSREIYELRKDYGMVELFALEDRIYRKRLDAEERIQSYLDTYPEDCPEDCQILATRIVRERQKLDDIGDACVQCQAFKFRSMVACF
jgi:hypothetical protein